MFEKAKKFVKDNGKAIGKKVLIGVGVAVGIAGVYIITKSGNQIDPDVIVLDENSYEILDESPEEDN